MYSKYQLCYTGLEIVNFMKLDELVMIKGDRQEKGKSIPLMATKFPEMR